MYQEFSLGAAACSHLEERGFRVLRPVTGLPLSCYFEHISLSDRKIVTAGNNKNVTESSK